MEILIDADSVLIKTHSAVLDLYRQKTNDYSTEIDNNSTWDISSICPKWNKKQVNAVFKNPDLFKLMQPMDNAVEVTKQLVKDGHKLTIVTIHKYEGIKYKGKMLKILFPHIKDVIYIDNYKNVMNKGKIMGDLIIDDHPRNIISSPARIKILYGNYSWNNDFETNSIYNCFRAENWEEVYTIIKFIENNKELYNL